MEPRLLLPSNSSIIKKRPCLFDRFCEMIRGKPARDWSQKVTALSESATSSSAPTSQASSSLRTKMEVVFFLPFSKILTPEAPPLISTSKTLASTDQHRAPSIASLYPEHLSVEE
jgi:hypothetical protein